MSKQKVGSSDYYKKGANEFFERNRVRGEDWEPMSERAQYNNILNSISELEHNLDNCDGYDDDFWENHNMFYDLCLQLSNCSQCIFRGKTDRHGYCVLSIVTDNIRDAVLEGDMFKAISFLQVIKGIVFEMQETLTNV